MRCECCDAELAAEEEAPAPNPFAWEIYGDDTPVVMCDDCREAAAWDI
jgi:hypothetical protein